MPLEQCCQRTRALPPVEMLVKKSAPGGGAHVEVCPHGRPVAKRISLAELLREFGRS